MAPSTTSLPLSLTQAKGDDVATSKNNHRSSKLSSATTMSSSSSSSSSRLRSSTRQQGDADPEEGHSESAALEALQMRFENYQLQMQQTLGKLNAKMELRQLGGFMLVLGIGSAFSTMALICQLIEGDAGRMQIEGFLLPILVGTVLQLGCGLVSMMTGFVAMLYAPYPSRKFHKICKWTVGVINLGPIAFVVTVIRLIQGAKDPPEFNHFIPIELHPTQMDIRFCAAMGILVLTAVCCSLIGGLTVQGLHMCAIMGQQPHSRHQAYHRIRLVYYNLLVLLGGLSQWMLGLFLWKRFGFGPYEDPVHVAAYTIHFPVVSIVVGILQTLMGVFGIWYKRKDSNDNAFIKVIAFVYINTVVLQFILQPAYAVEDVFNAEGATVASVYLGFFVMPAFLDYLVRTTPVQPCPEHYGLPEDAYYKEDFLAKLLRMEPKNHKCKTAIGVQQDDKDACDRKDDDNHHVVDNDSKNYCGEGGCRLGKKASQSSSSSKRLSATTTTEASEMSWLAKRISGATKA